MASVGQAERVTHKRVIALFRNELGYRYLGDWSVRVHLLEPSHNARFKALMSRNMPNWSIYRQMLNRLPARHEEWDRLPGRSMNERDAPT